jgi:hypothetical protein
MNETEKNLKELTEQLYDNLTKTINEFKEKLKETEKLTKEAEKKKTAWDLKMGDSYYYIGELGHVYPTGCITDVQACYLETRKNVGNAFLTEEEAKIELQKKEVEALLQKYGGVPFRKLDHVNLLLDTVALYLELDDNDELFLAADSLGKNFDVENVIPFGFENLSAANEATEKIGEKHLIAYACGELYEDGED